VLKISAASRFTYTLLLGCVLMSSACGTKAPAPATYPAPAHELPAPTAPLTREARIEATEQFHEARAVFEQRCVVCHGCYDAPCQLILSSPEGIARGASKDKVYEATRLFAATPTRLFIDAHDVPGWRAKKFFPVLPEAQGQDPRTSLLLRMLELKREHPLPENQALPKGFELGLNREAECPSEEEFGEYAEEHPLWGMPYALPGLSEQEHEQLTRWVEAGTPSVAPPALVPAAQEAVAQWEAFLNQPELKARLMARYIYEHLFLASLHFEHLQASEPRTFYRLVRSRTPSGQPVEEIATRRPFEDPGSAPFYYRLLRKHDAVLAKTHMPYALSPARMERYRELFLTPIYEVEELPPYTLEVAANPFRAFHALPAKSRYRFMLDEAEFTMMGFIKGPVCRGQVALDVIQDRFWVMFVNPDSPVLEAEDAFLAGVSGDLDLPAEGGSNGHLLSWLRYARQEKKYLEAKSKFLNKLAQVPGRVNLDIVWDGEGHNPNAALTVLRHFDSATVLKGFVGGPSKTAWLVSYAILERIHYLLVAGFDVFGNVGHQLNTRMYMDFLRMESEHNFLDLLPMKRRRALVDAWYRDVRGNVKDQVYGKIARFDHETNIVYRTQQPELELLQMMAERLTPVRECKNALGRHEDEALRNALTPLALASGMPAALMPETSFLEVRDGLNAPHYFTLLRDSSHTNVAHLFREDERRAPEEDQLTVLQGFVGSYPNALFRVERRELEAFVATVRALSTHASYELLHARFGVSRTSPEFWPLLDRLHAAYRKQAPLEAGLFDLNRLDGR
jgi:hypothetical protein